MAFNKKKADDRKEWLRNYEVCIRLFSLYKYKTQIKMFFFFSRVPI